MITLRQLSEQLGLDFRTLRYVIEAELVPGLSSVNRGRGSRRELTTSQARLVATAAALYAEGLRGEGLRRVLAEIREKDGAKRVSIPLGSPELPIRLTVDLSSADFPH